VRELKNVVERAVYRSFASDEPISQISFDPFDSPWRPGAQTEADESGISMPSDAYDFKEHIQQLEMTLLKSALQKCRFNQKKTADFLGMTYHQLRGYLRKYELTDQED
jgi:psp operon transcriptional activator